MKGKIVIHSLGYHVSRLVSFLVVAAVFAFETIRITAHSFVGVLPVLYKRENRKRFIWEYVKSAVFVPGIPAVKAFKKELEGSVVDKVMIKNKLRDVSPGGDTILFCGKILQLQRKVYLSLFRKWFLVTCAEKELDILCRHGSPSYLGHEILKIAGVSKKRTFSARDMSSIAFAYRRYLEILRVHLKYFEQESVLKRNGISHRSVKLYPDIVSLKRIDMNKSRVVIARNSILQRIKMEAEYRRFSNYLELQTLLIKE